MKRFSHVLVAAPWTASRVPASRSARSFSRGSSVMASCGPTGSGFGGDADASSGDGSMLDVAPDNSIMWNVDASDASQCTTCSGDLHSVLACGTNQVIQTCTGNTGCGPGGCIDACTAAAASKSSIGCDYYSLPPDAWTHGSCFCGVRREQLVVGHEGLARCGRERPSTRRPTPTSPKGSGTSITHQAIPTTGIPANSMAIVF